MLEASTDFPSHLAYSYLRGRPPYTTFVAWRGHDVVGVLTGSFDADLSELDEFNDLSVPPGRHAFLERLHVDDSARGLGVGCDLLSFYADEAELRGCTFIGGSIDLSSDPADRKAFFRSRGFSINSRDRFGAYPSDVVPKGANRRRY